MTMEKQIHMGHIISSDTLGLSLHETAKKGHKKTLKQILKSGIFVDYPNDEGQSALFCACCENKDATAQVLLKAGANPNERSNCGMTPLHMTCYNGNIGLLVKLIEAGGDLRLHDYDGRSPKDWAMVNKDPKKRNKMVEFLEKSHMFAVTHTGRDLPSSPHTGTSNMSGRIPSLIQMIRKKVGIDPSLHIDPLKRVQSMGFGSVYLAGEAQGAVVSVIPVVSENALYHDSNGVTYENGAFLVMESMSWGSTAVTVKRLHKVAHPGGYVDVLISEMEQLGKIRHPNVLLLMGVCQTTSLDSIVLVFERIGLGSLYYYLHQRVERLPTQNIRDILQQICSALMFLHGQNFIHCNLSSHAITLVTPFSAKLGNFEHMIDSSKADMGKQSAVTQIKFQNTLYNWMAPELMKDHPATFLCDVYSYSSIIWEMFECEIPWDMCDTELIKHKLLVEKQQLRIESTRMPALFKSIINLGLQLDPYDRQTDFDKIYKWLMGHPDQPISQTAPSCEPSPGKQSSGQRSRPTSATPSPSKRRDKDIHILKNPPVTANAPYLEEYSPNEKHKRNVHSSKQAYNENHHNRHSPDGLGKFGKGNRVKIAEDGLNEMTNRRYEKETSHGKIPFSAGNRDWVCNVQRSKDVDFYSYSAKMQHDTPSPPRYAPHDEEDTYAKKYMVDESSDSCSDEDEVMVKKQYLQTKNAAKHRYFEEEEDQDEANFRKELNKRDYIPSSPTSAPLSTTNFSYLKLYDTSTGNGGHSVVKPASHCTEAGCPKSSGQLTTAGSLFALYNSGTDLNELAKRAVGAPTSRYSTFPRNIKTTRYYDEYETQNRCASPEEKTDPQWFGGKGSVKNLVQLYQDQNEDHNFQQKVLDGKVDYHDCSTSQCRIQEKSPEKLFHYDMERLPPKKGLEYQQFVKAFNGPSMTRDNTEPKYTNMRDEYRQQREPERNLGEVESDSQCSNSSASNTNTDQIKKAKAVVARERALEYQKQQDEDGGLLDEIMEAMSKSTKQRKQQFLDSGDVYGQRGKQEFDMKEYYIDDDISTDEDRSHIKLQGNAGTRMQHKDWKYHMRSTDKYKIGKQGQKKIVKKYKRESAIPKPKAVTRPMMMSAMHTEEPPSKGFSTTVTVESSLVRPGEHHLRHMATDLATGKTKLLHQETVQATTVRSRLEA